jgi:hypothetical protein
VGDGNGVDDGAGVAHALTVSRIVITAGNLANGCVAHFLTFTRPT